MLAELLSDFKKLSRKEQLCLITIFMATQIIAILSGISGDYLAYEDSWRFVADGFNPYNYYRDQSNLPIEVVAETQYHAPIAAYPPLFLLLTPLFMIHSLLPKLLILQAYWFGVLVMLRFKPTTSRINQIAFYYVLLNPMFIANAAWVGYIDVLVFTMGAVSVYLLSEDKDLSASAVACVSFMTKFLGLLLAPVVVLKERANRRKLLLLNAAFYLLSTALWLLIFGSHSVVVVLFHANRDPSKFSIFLALDQTGWRFSTLSLPLLLVGGGAVLIASYLREWDWIDTAACLYAAFWAFSKVAHLQFIIMLSPFLLIWCGNATVPQRKAWRAIELIIFFLIIDILWITEFEYVSSTWASIVGGVTGILFFAIVFAENLAKRRAS